MSTKTVEVRHAGALRFEAQLGSGHQIAFDDVADGTVPGPMEAVLAALAACTAMDVMTIALKKRQNVARYTVHAESTQRDEYPRIYTRIDLVHEVEGPGIDSAAIRRCIELSARTYCPVSNMLAAGETEIHHRYRIVRPDEPVDEGEVIVTGPRWPIGKGEPAAD